MGGVESRSVDVGVVEVILEIVEEIGVGELALVHHAFAEHFERVDVVDVHRHRRPLLFHLREEIHLHRPHLLQC
ncbi:unnamed protein product [Linum trigynum]|uniref:Uncharacterized protein n=1 Tax=Linum trigynum TaxID=586398 RepID=A0AAV2CIR2_9ROSI